MKKPQRIRVLGTSGSGKTYLAKKLSKELKIKYYDLDDIFWIKKYTKKLPKHKRKEKAKDLTKRRKWIIEGIYGDWSLSSFKKSDLVIWLDPPFRIRSWRIFKRYLRRKLDKSIEECWKDCFGLIKYSRTYKRKSNEDSESYKSHREIINKHKINFIILRNRKQINKFLGDISK